MNANQTLTINSNKESANDIDDIASEEKPIPSSKLNDIVGKVELSNDFDEEIELRNYFESKHL
ncbi:hypothetical protein EZ456_24575 [Pedobacter psychrodurus]|uniref:Uncharacterized protein n=1 Tax=Pedobacter psychrodurus TaxID=2530456 RepID=A0A4R0PBM9_9SPHI|nr:hypothetical protein [Pedobacter psychrodurus]TCD14850.1 hypothetical protein EZ456_24575 [Pedobacter psychrodurus]